MHEKIRNNGKNIIPVMLAGFEWPKPMPEGLEELPNYQAITSAGHRRGNTKSVTGAFRVVYARVFYSCDAGEFI